MRAILQFTENIVIIKELQFHSFKQTQKKMFL